MICILLRLDSYETNQALHLYQYMPMLDQENDRDDVLIDIIEENTSCHRKKGWDSLLLVIICFTMILQSLSI